MNIENIASYMSFFFTAKYINQNGISARNVAPNFDDKKDIFSKTAKLVNLSINHMFSNFRSFHMPKEMLSSVLQKNDISDEFVLQVNNSIKARDTNLQTAPFKRINNRNVKSISEYCSFISKSKISFNIFNNYKDFFTPITDTKTKEFISSVLIGSNFSPLNFNSIYTNSYNDYFVHRFFSENKFNNLKFFILDEEKINLFDDMSVFLNNISMLHRYNTSNEDYYSISNLFNTMHYNNDTYGYAPVIGDNIKYHINRYNITQLSKYNSYADFLILSSYNLDNIYQNVNAQNILKKCFNAVGTDENHRLSAQNVNALEDLNYINFINNDKNSFNIRIKYQKIRSYLAIESKFIEFVKFTIDNKSYFICITNSHDLFSEKGSMALDIELRLKPKVFNSSADYSNFISSLRSEATSIFGSTT